MSWKLLTMHPWEDPLAFTTRFAQLPDFTLLYSGRKERFGGNFSFLFLEPVEQCRGNRWSELPPLQNKDSLPQWIGYLGYGMRGGIERYTRGTPSFIDLPDFWLVRYARMFRFDHGTRKIEEFINERPEAKSRRPVDSAPSAKENSIRNLRSNLTRTEYEANVSATLEKIRGGDFYQANITRKFFGEFTTAPDSWSIFCRLCELSPAPYSAFIKHDATAIVSSSPECFLSVDEQGAIISRPIKGSAPRSADAKEDKKLQDDLLASEKNSAENLMIVDLMRNDLSRVSVAGSVKVSEQSALYSYATIHHLVSTVTAQKVPKISAYEVVRAAFPPGSMTGAPKIAAVEWCTAREKLERGIYSGAIGWFGGNDTCDFSVVIRTLIIDGNHFEFQVGGGIVADSTPEDEWRETLTKARGIAGALGIKESQLAAL